jgi:hypothetical protein
MLRAFFEFRCKSKKKCAKSKILNMKVRNRQFKCHQKISWVWFAENDIINYGLILNRNGASDQKISLFFSIIRCVQNQTIVANIVPSKPYPRNLLVAFKLSNSHFYIENFWFSALFCRFTAKFKICLQHLVHHPLGLLHSENDVVLK